MFMEIVQQHERLWGMEQYPDRPTLTQLIASPIVVMWYNTQAEATLSAAPDHKPVVASQTSSRDGRLILTCHQNAQELNDLLTRMHTGTGGNAVHMRKISHIFVNQKLVKFSIKVVPAQD